MSSVANHVEANPLTRIEIVPELRDLYWLHEGGKIEEQFRSPAITAIHLDLAGLVWADPVPLLSLACLCAEFRDRGGQLTIELGKPDKSNHQFCIFFAQHGFLAAIARDTPVHWSGRIYQPDEHGELEQVLRALIGALAYQDAECIPARLLSVRDLTLDRLDELVESLVDIAHPRITSWLPGLSRRRGLMSHQLRIFLGEALDNVQEHAYRNGDTGYGAIYARIRAGRPEEPAAQRAWWMAKRREQTHCPTIERCRAERRPGWVELFVCDVGLGITHDFPDEKSPLQKMSAALFRNPVSRIADRAGANKTNMTGLQRIGQLLLAGREDSNNRGDFVRVYSNGEWIGEHLPWPSKEEGTVPGRKNAHGIPGAKPPSGTVLHFALEPPPASAAEQATLYPGAFVAPTRADLTNVREELASERSHECKNVALYDVYRIREQTAAHDLAELSRSERAPARTLVVRPARIQRKMDLVIQIEHVIKRDFGATDIIFADVPWASAIDFYNILAMQSSWRESASNVRVHILSQDWFCVSLVYNPRERAFEATEQAARAFLSGTIDQPSAAQAAAVLRRQDSLLFWKEAKGAYLNEPVQWRATADDAVRPIWGYIDLNYALARPVVHEIVRRAVRRTVSSFIPRSVDAADDIIERILGSDFERGEPDAAEPAAAGHTVLAGSVLGSGNTLKRFERGARAPYDGFLQVLRHPAFARTEPAELLALDWLPPKRAGNVERPPTFARVANTPFVIRGGESVVPLARFARSVDSTELPKSLYGERPADAYQRWQRLGILRMGHLTYGFNHDLLTLRLADALVYDTAEGGIMLNWLAAQIREWIPNVGGRSSGFVVYAQHAVTSELALALSRHKALDDILFFPAAAAASQGKAALLLSPMTREAMIATCRDTLASGGSAVILDDAIISGVTMRTIRQAVEGLWEGLREIGRINQTAELSVHTLAIVDRSGEPAQRAIVERNLTHDRRYWRWDVPSLGHSGSCVLCGLHARWQALASAVHGSLLKERLEQWLKQWAATPVEDGRFDTGIPARRLPTQTATRFGIEPNGRAHRVSHTLAVSRVSIAAEIAGATTRKDYPLRKAREALVPPVDGRPPDIDVETALELIATQLLLFQDGLGLADRSERLEALLQLLWSHPEATITTALAGMTMLVDQSLVPQAWEACQGLIERHGFPNVDTILVALALFQMGGGTAPPPLKPGSPWEVFDLCRRPSTELRSALAMVLRVFGWSPNSIHRTALPDRLSDRQIAEPALSQTILMLERLADAFQGISLLAIEGSTLQPRDDSVTIRRLARDLAAARDADIAHATEGGKPRGVLAVLDEAWMCLFSVQGLHLPYRRQLCAPLAGYDAAVNVLLPAWRILAERWDKFVADKGEEMAAKWPEPPLIWFEPADGATKPVDLYYDATIRSAVADLMSNVVHRSHAITCPWPEGSEIPEADLWGRVRVAPDGASATIELVNGRVGDGEVRPQWTSSLVHLNAMGGSVETRSDTERQLVFTTITLPTAAGLTAS